MCGLFFFLVQLLENMTEVVRKGIIEAEQQLLKANEEKIMEEVCFNECFLFGQNKPSTHLTVKSRQQQ